MNIGKHYSTDRTIVVLVDVIAANMIFQFGYGGNFKTVGTRRMFVPLIYKEE